LLGGVDGAAVGAVAVMAGGSGVLMMRSSEQLAMVSTAAAESATRFGRIKRHPIESPCSAMLLRP
jgi:hypothetical protein